MPTMNCTLYIEHNTLDSKVCSMLAWRLSILYFLHRIQGFFFYWTPANFPGFLILDNFRHIENFMGAGHLYYFILVSEFQKKTLKIEGAHAQV